MYTAASAFFEALIEAGVKNCFVNLGSDHPSILEAMIKGKNEQPDKFPNILTCPSEMVALSMADGYARLTNEPQCVIVHVDVGTQALGAAIHNASVGRAPVLVFAGLSPFTIEGEMRGSRTEFIHWMQDVPDQRQIVSQYCRYTAEIKTGKNVKQMVHRALQFATSEPKGPVYLMGAREVMEEEIQPYSINPKLWRPVGPSALPGDAVAEIAELLSRASKPLVITGYSGRNHSAVQPLVDLADSIPQLQVLDTGGSDLCFPSTHPGWLSMKYGVDDSVKEADAILVLHCDVPWINTLCKPQPTCRIVHLDSDPIKQLMPVFYIDAEARYRVDAFTALTQLADFVKTSSEIQSLLSSTEAQQQRETRQKSYDSFISSLDARAVAPAAGERPSTAYVCASIRKMAPKDSIFAIEAVTNFIIAHEQLRATEPGTWLNCGGGGLGWSGGGALGIKLAADQLDAAANKTSKRVVIQVVGDGSYLFSFPSSVYWISQRYQIPVITIVLNNSGWNAPRKSMLLVHPDGPASKATNKELNISFDPPPNYSEIARAASDGQIYAARVATGEGFTNALEEAFKSVQSGTSAVIDVGVA